MSVEVKVFGTCKDGREAKMYVLKNSKGMEAHVTDFGANLVKLLVPDKKGKVADVVLGFDTLEEYYRNGSFFGAVIGPNANRIGGASFEIDGVKYSLDVNDGPNNLHSDFQKGYHKQLWTAKTTDNGVIFTLDDADGNMGFPGNKTVSLEYSIDEENGLTLHYHGVSDKKTIINLTNHSYFNLDGHDSGKNIEDNLMWIDADCYTPVVAGAIPTGEIAPVKGTPMDFTKQMVIGDRIFDNFEQLKLTQGYDHNWVVNGFDGSLKHIATVTAPISGRVMKTYTNLPGVQFYAGNCIAPEKGKGGAPYGKRSGLCLETQFYPDTIHQANFPSCVFGQGKEYDSITVYRFE